MTDRPEVLFVLANHSPRSRNLANELERISQTGYGERADYKVAIVTYGGHGISRSNVVPLKELDATPARDWAERRGSDVQPVRATERRGFAGAEAAQCVPAQFGHRLRFNSAGHSDSFRPPVPLDGGHRFRFMAAAPGAR